MRQRVLEDEQVAAAAPTLTEVHEIPVEHLVACCGVVRGTPRPWYDVAAFHVFAKQTPTNESTACLLRVDEREHLTDGRDHAVGTAVALRSTVRDHQDTLNEINSLLRQPNVVGDDLSPVRVFTRSAWALLLVLALCDLDLLEPWEDERALSRTKLVVRSDGHRTLLLAAMSDVLASSPNLTIVATALAPARQQVCPDVVLAVDMLDDIFETRQAHCPSLELALDVSLDLACWSKHLDEVLVITVEPKTARPHEQVVEMPDGPDDRECLSFDHTPASCRRVERSTLAQQ